MNQTRRYHRLVRELSEKAIADAWPTTDNMAGSLSCALPAAHMLCCDAEPPAESIIQLYGAGVEALAAAVDQADGAPPRVNDTLGHFRDLYYPLAVHLQLSAWLQWGKALSESSTTDAWQKLPRVAEPLLQDQQQRAPYQLWRGLCLLEYAALEQADTPSARAYRLIDRALQQPGPGESLHPWNDGDTLEWWTFHELAGLQALADLLAVDDVADWRHRLRDAARYHLDHTQPDNATSLPWGLAAFLRVPEAIMLADQQLHDTSTVLYQGGESLLAGLLLADTVAGLDEA